MYMCGKYSAGVRQSVCIHDLNSLVFVSHAIMKLCQSQELDSNEQGLCSTHKFTRAASAMERN